MTFKEFVAMHEMGYWRGEGSAIPLPSPGGQTVQVGTLDMRFEDYGFPGGGYGTNWYAVLPTGGVVSNHGAAWENRYHPTEAAWKQYRAALDAPDKKPNMWLKVPDRPAATNPDVGGGSHPWWDYAEGLDEGGNRVLKPGLWRSARVTKAG